MIGNAAKRVKVLEIAFNTFAELATKNELKIANTLEG